jgi:hypothetical protein
MAVALVMTSNAIAGSVVCAAVHVLTTVLCQYMLGETATPART